MKFKFTGEFEPMPFQDAICSKRKIEFEADSLSHILEQFEMFLRGCGYIFEGQIDIINDFENTAAEIAIEKEFDYVICGHIHQAEKKVYTNEKGSVTYLNSGDWVESLTALEYNDKSWTIYQYKEDQSAELHDEESFINLASKLDVRSLYNSLIAKAE